MFEEITIIIDEREQRETLYLKEASSNNQVHDYIIAIMKKIVPKLD